MKILTPVVDVFSLMHADALAASTNYVVIASVFFIYREQTDIYRVFRCTWKSPGMGTGLEENIGIDTILHSFDVGSPHYQFQEIPAEDLIGRFLWSAHAIRADAPWRQNDGQWCPMYRTRESIVNLISKSKDGSNPVSALIHICAHTVTKDVRFIDISDVIENLTIDELTQFIMSKRFMNSHGHRPFDDCHTYRDIAQQLVFDLRF